MDPRRKTDTRKDEDGVRDEAPGLEEQDWEAVETGAIAPDSVPENGDLRYDVERSGEATDDDDNAYQNSDEGPAGRQSRSRVAPQSRQGRRPLR